MRAIVMEIKNDYIIVLTKDGQFKKMNQPKNKIDVGMEISIKDPIHYNLRRIAAVFVVIILMSGFGVSTYAYYTPYGYINLDINPSVEIIYNRFNRVLKIAGINEDGKNLVNSIEHYKHQKVEEMMSEIINQSISEEKPEDTDVLIAYNKMNKNTLDLVKDSMDSDSHVNVYAVEVSESEFEEAKKNEVSPGKVKLIDNIQANNSKYNAEELEEKSVKELIEIVHEEDKINDKRKINKEQKQKNEKSNQNKDKNRNKNKNKEDEKKQDDDQSLEELNEDQEDEDEILKIENKGKKSVFKNNKSKRNKEVKDQDEVKDERKEKKAEKQKKKEKEDKDDDDDNEIKEKKKDEEDNEREEYEEDKEDEEDEENHITKKSERKKIKAETEKKDKGNKGKNNNKNKKN